MGEKQSDVKVKTETKNNDKISKGKIALIVIIAIIYTAVVSLVSSVITKNVIEYKEEKIVQEKIEEEKKKKEEQTTGSDKVDIVLDGDDSSDESREDAAIEEAYIFPGESPYKEN